MKKKHGFIVYYLAAGAEKLWRRPNSALLTNDTNHYLSYHAKLIIFYADNALWILHSQLSLDWL